MLASTCSFTKNGHHRKIFPTNFEIIFKTFFYKTPPGRAKQLENNLKLVFPLLEILHKSLVTNVLELILINEVNTTKIIDNFEGFRSH